MTNDQILFLACLQYPAVRVSFQMLIDSLSRRAQLHILPERRNFPSDAEFDQAVKRFSQSYTRIERLAKTLETLSDASMLLALGSMAWWVYAYLGTRS